MLIDDYINYLNESYEIYDEVQNYGSYTGKKLKPTYKIPVTGEPYLMNQGKRSLRGWGSNTDAKAVSSITNSNGEKSFAVRYTGDRKKWKKTNDVLNGRDNSLKKLGKNAAKTAVGAAAVAGAAYGAKKLHDHIKAKRAEKAKKIAVEEGCTLDEAYKFILECEMDLINEGYELYEIYED